MNMDTALKEKLKIECEKIIRNGDLSVLTPRIIRNNLQVNLGLEKDALESSELKTYIRDLAEQITSEVLETSEVSETKPDTKRKAQNSESKVNTPKRPKKRGATIEDSEEEEEEKEKEEESVQPENTVETATEDSHVSTSDSEDHCKNNPDIPKETIESEASEVEDISPKKRSKKQQTTTKKPTPTPKATGPVSEKDQETIKNLKMYIGKCGVRKMWFREFKGIEDKPKLQIKKLKEILAELGMSGRPTIEKCKKIQAARELRAERESLSKENIIEEDEKYGRRARASRRTTQLSNKPTSETSDKVDFSFLGDQESELSSEDDSDEVDEKDVLSAEEQSEQSDSE